MDRSCTLFRLLFQPPREPTDYGCQREQQSALSNQRVRSVAASLESFYYSPRFIRRITHALDIVDGTRAVQFRAIGSSLRFQTYYREFRVLFLIGYITLSTGRI